MSGAKRRSLHRPGPAAAAGLRAGDKIVSVNGKPVSKAAEVTRCWPQQPDRSRSAWTATASC